MNLKREVIEAKERLDKIEAAISGLLLASPVATAATKTVKKVTAKKKAKAKKKSDPTSVKTTSDQIAQVEM